MMYFSHKLKAEISKQVSAKRIKIQNANLKNQNDNVKFKMPTPSLLLPFPEGEGG